MVTCLERGVDLHMAQLMPLPLTVSCFSKIQIGCTFLVLAHLGSPGKRAVKRARVCVCVVVLALNTVRYLYVNCSVNSSRKGTVACSLRTAMVEEERMRSVDDFPCMGLVLSSFH